MNIILIAGYILFQLVADVTAVKIIGPVFGQFVPAAVFIYAITFTWRDLCHKSLGKKNTVILIWTAAIANVIMALYFAWTVSMPSAPFWANQDSYALILGIVPRIVAASIFAEIVSELIDTEVYHRVKLNQVWRVLISNFISLPIDSLLFVSLAFYGTMDLQSLLSVIYGQIIIKGGVTVISLPVVYTIDKMWYSKKESKCA